MSGRRAPRKMARALNDPCMAARVADCIARTLLGRPPCANTLRCRRAQGVRARMTAPRRSTGRHSA